MEHLQITRYMKKSFQKFLSFWTLSFLTKCNPVTAK